MKVIILFGLLFALAVGCNNESNPPASADGSTAGRPAAGPANRVATDEHPAVVAEPADRTNTGVNVRDRDSAAKTPLDQKENKADIDITADIRKQIGAAKMSVNAQNVKIITQDGKVTLRGPVKTDEEKTKIEEIARAVAGSNNVDDQLDVAND